MEKTDFELRECLGDAFKEVALPAHEKGLKLNLHIESDVPGHLAGDAGRLRQVILNLVRNGVKFTQWGEVNLHVSTESRAGEGVWLHFAISDTGIGIPADKLRLIFEPFTQADGSSTASTAGQAWG